MDVGLMKKITKFVSFSFVGIAIVGFVVWLFQFQVTEMILNFYFNRISDFYYSQSPALQIKRNLSLIKEDAALLAQIGFFNNESVGSKDASSYLAPLIEWDDESDQQKSVEAPI